MIAFVFPGQGAQYVGMGQSIAARYPAAADLFARAGAVLGFDLLALCAAGPEEQLRATENTQPAVLVTGLACAAALAAHGVRPDAVAGLSLGEYAALGSAGGVGFGGAGAAGVRGAVAAAKTAGARRAVLLAVSAPFHTSLMVPAAERLAAVLERVALAGAAPPGIS